MSWETLSDSDRFYTLLVLADPFQVGFDLQLNQGCLVLLKRSCFIQQPPHHPVRSFWSQQKELVKLTSPPLAEAVSKGDVYGSSLLVCLALGLRLSQLHALSWKLGWPVFWQTVFMCLWPCLSCFLHGHRLQSTVTTVLMDDGLPHQCTSCDIPHISSENRDSLGSLPVCVAYFTCCKSL